jgi:magnesium transporter
VNDGTAAPEAADDAEPVIRLAHNLLRGEAEDLEDYLSLLHPAVVADAIEALPRENRQTIWAQASPSIRGELLLEVKRDVRAQLIEFASSEELLAAVIDLEPDEQADLAEDLPADILPRLLPRLDDANRDAFQLVRDYPHDSAGGLMDVDHISVRADLSIAAVLRYLRRIRMRRGSMPEHSDQLMVVDRDNRFVGTLKLSDLVSVDPMVTVEMLMDSEVQPVADSLEASAVARLFENRDLISAPVADHAGRLIGRITVDDVVDVIRGTADSRLLRGAGLPAEVDLFAPVQTSVKRRAGWLGVHLATAFLAAWVIWLFEATIEQIVALAVLMPVVASMAGVAGNQTLTLVTRGIALAQLDGINTWRLLMLELRIALWNGLLWAAVVTLAAALWYADLALGLTFGLALAISMLAAALTGTLVPVILSRLGVDPAVAGGVVLMGATDVVGFGSFLALAAWFLI